MYVQLENNNDNYRYKIIIFRSLQALIRAQVDYYGESTRLHRQLGVEVGQGAGKEEEEQLQTDEEYERDLERQLQQIKALSIVGS